MKEIHGICTCIIRLSNDIVNYPATTNNVMDLKSVLYQNRLMEHLGDKDYKTILFLFCLWVRLPYVYRCTESVK